jgi:hypothetical protein
VTDTDEGGVQAPSARFRVHSRGGPGHFVVADKIWVPPEFSAWDFIVSNAIKADAERQLRPRPPEPRPSWKRRFRCWQTDLRWRVLDLCRVILRLPRDE